jgi:polyisoprenoid-binding protein YceI
MLIVMVLLAATELVELNEKSGVLYARVWKDPDTIGARFSHDHVIVAKRWTAKVSYGAEGCEINASIDVAGLEPDEPAMRKKFQLPPEVSDSDRKKIGGNMREKDQLDAEKFKTISFKATKCSGAGKKSGLVEIEGDVTIRGKTKHVAFPLTLDWSGSGLKVKGSFVVQHKDFGFEPYSGALGAVKNGPDIEIGIEL